MINGILNILKPPGMTSFDVIAVIRKIADTKKVGHTGTLDPQAVGVLPVFTGKATKIIEYVENEDKAYRAEMTLGVETDTQDAWGNIVSKQKSDLGSARIEGAVKSFCGNILQVPPMYSAVKIKGKKLYELARKGINIDREPRNVVIKHINVIRVKANRVIFDLECSKGTYIRTLCHDIGKTLGCGAHMSFLIRKRAGSFKISESITLERLANGINGCIMDMDSILSHMDKVVVHKSDEKRFVNGSVIEARNTSMSKNGHLVRVYNGKGNFLAVGKLILLDKKVMLKPEKLLI